MAVPFWLLYTKFGIGAKFFYFLPPVYQAIGFFDCVWLFVCLSILKSVLFPAAVSLGKNA